MTILLSDIIAHASRVFGVSVDDIKGKRRNGRFVRARYAAILVARVLTPLSYPEIGRRMGRDHSTIIHGHHESMKRMRRDAKYAEQVARVAELAILSEPYKAKPWTEPKPTPKPSPPPRKLPSWRVPDHLLPKEQVEWWARGADDMEILDEAVRDFIKKGGSFVEVRG